MSNPTISVITVAFNALEALKLTAASVVGQDYPYMEYLIVDGGSTDGTVSWLEPFAANCGKDHSIRYVSEPDGGIYDAMNKASRMASGQYSIFMNAGDTFVSSSILSQMTALIMPGADVIYGDVMKNGQVKESLSPRNCHKMFYCHQCVLTSTSCIRQYPFDTAHRYSADFKQAKQLLLAGKTFQHVHMAVACFDTGGVSNVHRSSGLWDNVKVVCELDSFRDRCRFLPHLLLPWAVSKLRGK